MFKNSESIKCFKYCRHEYIADKNIVHILNGCENVEYTKPKYKTLKESLRTLSPRDDIIISAPCQS